MLKTISITILFLSTVLAYETTTYPFFENMSDDEIRANYLGLSPDFDKDTLTEDQLQKLIEYINPEGKISPSAVQRVLKGGYQKAERIANKINTELAKLENNSENIENKLGHNENIILYNEFKNILKQFQKQFPEYSDIIIKNKDILNVYIVGGVTDINRNKDARGDLDIVFLHQKITIVIIWLIDS